MNKEEYLRLLEFESDKIELTDADIKEWVDKIIDNLKAVRESIYDLCWGNLNTDQGEYDEKIEACYFGDEFNRLHIYKGIYKLAKVLNCDVQTAQRRAEDGAYEERYFIYRECRIFEVWQEDKDDGK